MTWRRRLFDVLFASAIRRMVLGVVVVLAVLTIAAAPADSTSVAVNIVTVLLMLAAPFLPLKQIHLSGAAMVLISMLLALLVAVIASVFTGELNNATLQGGTGVILLEFAKLWAIQQAVFQLLKDHPKVGPLMTDAPKV